jgi:DNA polymerase-1
VTFEVATTTDFKDLIAKLLEHPVLAGDIETSGFNPRRDKVLSLGVSYAKNKAVVFPGPIIRKYPGPFHRLFRGRNTFVWHNGKYDAAFLRQLGLPARVDEDTMLLHYLLSEGNRDLHGLKELAADLLGADPNYDAEVKKYAPKMSDSYAKVPRDILYRYNAMDTDHTFQLYELMRPKLDQRGNETLKWCYQNLIIPMSKFLQEVEHAGVWVHTPTLGVLGRELGEELAQAERELQEVAQPVWDPIEYAKWKETTKVPKTFSPGSSYQLTWVLNKFNLYPKDPRTKKPSTSKDALKDLPQIPFVLALGKYRSAQKMLSTYVEGIEEAVDDDGRVHATYLIHGTATGRLSSRGPNMQNIPRDSRIRNIFQAPPGRTLVELDYSQVELRVLAYLSRDRGLWDIYTSGRDLHDEVAARLFPGWYARKHTVLGKEQRIRAKFVNFGVAYGRGVESLVAEFKIPMREASKIIQDWWRAFPEAHRFIQESRAASRSGRPLETPLGRRRRFGLVTQGNRNALENEAANFPIQSTASDLTILSAMTIYPNLRKWDAHIINLVHDSILIECPTEVANEVAGYAKTVMEILPRETLETELPFDVGMSIAQRWGDLK